MFASFINFGLTLFVIGLFSFKLKSWNWSKDCKIGLIETLIIFSKGLFIIYSKSVNAMPVFWPSAPNSEYSLWWGIFEFIKDPECS